MKVSGFDHIVICVDDVDRTLDFYESVLGMTRRAERPGKWSLHFGVHKISVQAVETVPDIARNTLPGTANFCLLTEAPIADVVARLSAGNVKILDGPGERDGANGPILSVYFHDPDGNLVEVSNAMN